MFKVIEVEMTQIADPFKILAGERYEFVLDLEVEEDDELYEEQGVQLRVVYVVEESQSKISRYEFINATTRKYMDIEMEDEELAYIEQLCKEQVALEE